MNKGKMDKESEWAALNPAWRGPRQSQAESSYRGRLNGQGGIKDISDTTDTLLITPAEQKLWDQLVGILSLSLWEVKVSGEPWEGDSRALFFSGSPEAILRAKEAISRLLILVGSLFRVNTMTLPQIKHRTAGFFHLCEGLRLFLWEGEASQFRVDAVMSLSTSGGKDRGNAVFAQTTLNQQGSLHTKMDVFLAHPPVMELATAAVKLALEAASSGGLRSLMICCSDPAISPFQAEAIVTGIEAFKRDHPDSSLENINFASSGGDDLAVFRKECGKLWHPGRNGQEQLRNMLLSLEAVHIEVVAGPSMKKKTDVAVIPLVWESHGLDWGPEVLAITRKALELAPQAAGLRPGEVLLVTAEDFPQFDCRDLYLVQLEGSWLKCKNPQEQAIRKMVKSCLRIFYGSFLESISFPVIEPVGSDQTVKGECLRIMLEEINHFLKELPNTWMKLVQVVPLLEWTLPCSVEDCFSAAVEPVGFCHPEDPLFLQYLKESPAAFHHFEVQLKEVGYRMQICSPWGIVFQATGKAVALPDLGATFWSVRDQYLLHCETRPEMLESLLEQVTVLKEFPSIKIYSEDTMWLVGLTDEMTSLFQRLTQRAFQRQLVDWEFPCEPLHRCLVTKDFLIQKLLPYNPLISIEIIATDPATVKFWGRRQRVEETKKCFQELLGRFYVQPVPLSKFQSEFIKALWGELFHNDFCLKRGIPAVLEISEVVQVAGLEWDKMKEAEEIIVEHVGEKTVEIAEALQWATETEEWKKLLHMLGTHKEVALHHVAANQVVVVGICPYITQVKESIKEYLRENSEVLKRITLARPELANAGQNLLHIMNWEHLRVTVTLQPNNQVLSMQVSGLRKYVRQALPVIRIDLDSLVPATIPLKRAALGEYFSGIGAGLLMEMAQQCHCIVRMEGQQVPERGATSSNSQKEKLPKDHLKMIYTVGRKSHVASLKQAVAGFIARFREETICHEAIVTFHDGFLNELCKNISHRFSIGLHHLGSELQIYGYQEDVGNLLEAIHRKIEEYQAEWIEAEAQYETVPYIIVKEILVQGLLLSNLLVSTEIIAEDPVTVAFRGPRQKVVELKKCFEEVLSDFQVLPVPLSDLQSQFVQAQWGKFFCSSFFIEQGILAVLEVSEVVQIAGLDLSTMKEAEEIIMRQVCQRTVAIAKKLKRATECDEWRALLHNLGSHEEVALHIASDQVTLVGICPHITEVEKSIKEYLQDNSSVEEKIFILRAELALAGENLLSVMEWDGLNVYIQIQSDNQPLALQVSGLQKYVKEAVQVIRTDLDSLVCGTLPLKKTSLVRYFSTDGASWLQEMAKQQSCIVKVKTQKSTCHSDGVTACIRNEEHELAEEAHPAEVCAVGRENDVAFLKQQVADFIAKFHEEIICSAEIATFSDKTLQELCKNTPHLFPVSFHLPREKVVQVAGSRDDVEKLLGAIFTLIEKRVNAKVQEAQEVWIDSKILYETVRWHHVTGDGWATFDMATNRLLEIEFAKKKMKVQVPWNGQKIDINLLKGEAVIPSNGKKFRIKREICLWDKNIAPHWEAMDDCLIKKVKLQSNSEEYKDVVRNFSKTAFGYTVLKVERIQNRYLWVSYCWKRSWMEKKNPERIQNERILYHGTLPDNCDSIQEIGFKSACRKLTLYGQGIYFGQEASRSAEYAKPDRDGRRFMFQARVLTGEYGLGGEKFVLPPMKPSGGGRYDSLVNVLRQPTIFVTFFDDHAYPEYLITFRGQALP